MSSEIWVFGYGSLIWNPGFEFKKSMIGEIKGYSRKFYQGSDVHRGKPEKLGRVVTLMEESEGSTWGQAFLPKDPETALAYLTDRESALGGYDTVLTRFYPRDTSEQPFLILVYIALPHNSLFRGPETPLNIARDIAFSEGQCGHNVEYLAKLAAFMRIELPHIIDEHLHHVENHVKEILHEAQQLHIVKLFSDAVESWLSRSANYLHPSSSGSSSSFASTSSSIQELLDFDEKDEMKFVDNIGVRKPRCIHKF